MDKVRIFISHSSHDRETVEALIRLINAALKDLSGDEIRCTSVEGHGPPGGVDFGSHLIREVVEAEVVIALLSPESMMSPWVLAEIGARLGTGKTLLTLLAPGVTAEDLRGPVSAIQALRCDSDSGLVKLLQQLASALSPPMELRQPSAFINLFPAVKIARGTKRPASSIYSGFLHLDSILFHEVEKEVQGWMGRVGEIIPTKYLFAHAESYKFYNQLVEERAYTIAQGNNLFCDQSENIADYLMEHVARDRALTIVSLGIGFGRKEVHLLKALLESGARVLLLAIDQNPAFIQAAISCISEGCAGRKMRGSFHCQFLVGDFDRIDELAMLLPMARPTVFLALGGTFGNQDEHLFLERLRRACRGESYLLMDFDTIPDQGRELDKGGYDTKVNKEFISSMFEIFCKERPRLVQALQSKDVFNHPSRVGGPDVADVIVMQAEFADGRKREFGYSTRYAKKAVEDFLARESWVKQVEFDDPKLPSISLLLCKLKPKKD